MSVNAAQAVRLAQKARERQKTELELAIDADVQMLKKIADDRMQKIPDDEGYYSFDLVEDGITYGKPKIVIDRFCEHMEKLGFIVPQVKCRNSFRKKKSYLIRFRPNEEAIRQAALLSDMDDGKLGSSDGSTVS